MAKKAKTPTYKIPLPPGFHVLLERVAAAWRVRVWRDGEQAQSEPFESPVPQEICRHVEQGLSLFSPPAKVIVTYEAAFITKLCDTKKSVLESLNEMMVPGSSQPQTP